MQRVGLIGFGSIAEHGHLPALQSLPGVEVGAVADLAPARRRRVRELLPRAEIYSEPLELIAQAEIDCLDICSPPITHAELIEAACRRGIPDIISEKPFVLTPDAFRGVAEARERSGSRVISVNNWMHSDLNQQVLGVLRAGEIGRVRSVLLRTGRPDVARGNDSWQPGWRTDLAYAGGGILLDHGWHQLYLLLGWFAEPVLAVRAQTRTIDPRHLPVEDEVEVELQFPTGAGRIELSWTASGRTNEGLIEGDDGAIEVKDDRIDVRNQSGERVLLFPNRLTQSSYHPEWFERMLRYNMLTTDHAEADRNFAEAGLLVDIISAAYRSARAGGKACYLPTLGDGTDLHHVGSRMPSDSSS